MEMLENSINPNAITYATMIDGLAGQTLKAPMPIFASPEAPMPKSSFPHPTPRIPDPRPQTLDPRL